MKCRRAALLQLHNTIVAAPDEVRDQIRNLTRMQRLRICAAWRPDTLGYRDPVVATKLSLKSLARRVLDLNDEIAELDRFIVPLVEELAPNLLQLEGVGIGNAGELMVAVGENPDRLHSEASFAMMCGACPIPASSGENSAPPPQSWREPPSQLRLAHDCHLPDAHRRANSSLCRSAYPRWALQTRRDALSQALRGPRDLQSPHRLDIHLTNMRASAACSTCPFAIRSVCRTWALRLRSAASATLRITRWPRRSLGCSRRR